MSAKIIRLTYDLQLDSDINFRPLAELKPYALLPEHHRFANKKTISLSQLADENFILLDLPLSDAYFMSLFSLNNVKPIIHARTKHIDVQRGLVANGYGYSLGNVRPLNKKSLDGSGLAYVPLSGENQSLTLGIAVLDKIRKTMAVDSFSQYCIEQISSNHIPGMATF
jgi:DNA-binding transcriptional LysR family regulator